MLQVLTKMEGHHAKWKVEIQKCSKYHAQTLQLPCNMKGSIFQMPQVPCKMRGSISTMQVDIAECWQYCKHPANVYCAFLCFNLDSFACFFSWLCKTWRNSWLHGFVCVHLFNATNATGVRKSQTQPTPKQRPQNRQLLCVPSATPPTTATTTTTRNYHYKYNCSYNYQNYSNYNKYNATRIAIQARTHN